jgi:hypothetical protein
MHHRTNSGQQTQVAFSSQHPCHETLLLCIYEAHYLRSRTDSNTYSTMAPPPPGQTAQQRLIALVQTLQFAWFAGHVTLLLTTLRYSLSYITFNSASRWARFSYRTAFVAAAVTYGIVVFKGYRARAKSGKGQGSPLQLIGDENVQYLGKSFGEQIELWLHPHELQFYPSSDTH